MAENEKSDKEKAAKSWEDRHTFAEKAPFAKMTEFGDPLAAQHSLEKSDSAISPNNGMPAMFYARKRSANISGGIRSQPATTPTLERQQEVTLDPAQVAERIRYYAAYPDEDPYKAYGGYRKVVAKHREIALLVEGVAESVSQVLQEQAVKDAFLSDRKLSLPTSTTPQKKKKESWVLVPDEAASMDDEWVLVVRKK